MALGMVLISMGSYWPTLKTNLNLSPEVGVIVYSVTAIFVIFAVVVCYSFLRIAVRSIADAPDELLDERQITVRNTSFRYAYFILSYILMGLMVLMFFGPELQMFQPEGNDGSYLVIAALFATAALPSMVMAWRERDI
jgi:Na+/H+ antiporter NhaD/arsenite permease-like protein